MANKVSRVQWVDILKYICIMFVMATHLESNTTFVYIFNKPFFLTGFFFAAGYVYRHKDSFGVFMKKKVKGLLWPWFFFSVFNILLSQLMSFNQHGSILEELKWNFLQIRGVGDGLWFVAALFVAFIPFYFVIGKYEKTSRSNSNIATLVIISLVLAVISKIYGYYFNPELLPWDSTALPWHLEYIFVAMLWMIFGYLFRTKYEMVFDQHVKSVMVIVAGIFYLLSIYIPFYMGIDIDGNKMIYILYMFVLEVIGVSILIYISKAIKPNNYILYLGQNTLLCFALHGKVYSVMQTVIKKIIPGLYSNLLGNMYTASAMDIALTIILSLLVIIPIYIINRWFPWTVGKKKEQSKFSRVC